jgi:hypothetical protein
MNAAFYCCVIVLCSTTFAQTTLVGTLQDVTFEKQGNPYIVRGNITIPADVHVTIREGCVFQFEASGGIIVDGTFDVAGTREEPVIFTSRTVSSRPVEWKGIYISGRADTVKLVNYVLEYASQGIVSHYKNFQITNGKTIDLQQQIPVAETLLPDENTAQTADRRQFRWYREGALAAGITGGALCLVSAVATGIARARNETWVNSSMNGIESYEQSRERFMTATKVIIGTGIPGALLFLSGNTLFIINRNASRKEPGLTLSPIFGRYNGCAVSMSF